MAKKKVKKSSKRRKNWLSTMEFQYKKFPGIWTFCSYSTFLKHRATGEEVRKRKAGTGSWTYEY